MRARWRPSRRSLDPTGGSVIVTLSRRNLVNLLHMLDDPSREAPALTSRDENVEILVQPQEDAEHYEDLGRAPGRMSWEPVDSGHTTNG